MELFFKLERKDNNLIIENNNDNIYIHIDEKIYHEYNKKRFELKELIKNDKNIEYILNKSFNLHINKQSFVFGIFNIQINDAYGIRSYYNSKTNKFDNYHIRRSLTGEYVDTIESIKNKGIKYKIIIANVETFIRAHVHEISLDDSCEAEKNLIIY
jgi:hypothetical protein